MTEYDYSPEAYERFTATQARISNWVEETRAATSLPATRLPSPHATSPPPISNHSSRHKSSSSTHTSRPRTRGIDNDHRHTHSRSRSSSHAHRPHPARSQTIPAPPPPGGPHSLTYAYAMQPPGHAAGPPLPMSNLSPRRAATLPANAHVQTQYGPDGRAQAHIIYYDPPKKTKQTLVVVPPAGGRVDVRYASPTPQPARQPPFLKRLLTSLPWSSARSSPAPRSTDYTHHSKHSHSQSKSRDGHGHGHRHRHHSHEHGHEKERRSRRRSSF